MTQHIQTVWGRVMVIGLAAAVLILAVPAEGQEHQIRKAKIYDEIYPLLLDADLYCSLFIHTDSMPELRITGAEREYEREILSDGDLVYLNQGRDDGLEPGQMFLILEIEQNLPGFGPIAFKRGRARIQALAAHQASAVIEKSCGWVRVGNYLVPFEPREPLMGKDLGYDVPPFEIEGTKGQIVYLETDFNQVGSNQWALIDVGEDAGLLLGQQLILYRVVKEGAPVQIFGNCVVIDVQAETATIKTLACRDAVRIGDQVMVRPTR